MKSISLSILLIILAVSSFAQGFGGVAGQTPVNPYPVIVNGFVKATSALWIVDVRATHDADGLLGYVYICKTGKGSFARTFNADKIAISGFTAEMSGPLKWNGQTCTFKLKVVADPFPAGLMGQTPTVPPVTIFLQVTNKAGQLILDWSAGTNGIPMTAESSGMVAP